MLLFDDPYYFSKLIGTVVLLTQVGVALTVLLLVMGSRGKWIQFLKTHHILLAFIVVLTAVSSSLIYSDVFHMAPCKLCWYQRIVIFPQIVVLGVALWRGHHRAVADFSIALACIAIPISIFHYLLQMTDAPAIHGFAPCDVTGQAPSCSGYYVIMYHYITIPMMALTASAAVLTLMVIGKMKSYA